MCGLPSGHVIQSHDHLGEERALRLLYHRVMHPLWNMTVISNVILILFREVRGHLLRDRTLHWSCSPPTMSVASFHLTLTSIFLPFLHPLLALQSPDNSGCTSNSDATHVLTDRRTGRFLVLPDDARGRSPWSVCEDQREAIRNYSEAYQRLYIAPFSAPSVALR